MSLPRPAIIICEFLGMPPNIGSESTRRGGHNYTNGLTANLQITDGPLQPGSYRFTASSAGATRLLDRAGNPLANSLPNGDSADYFLLGNLGVGTVIELSTLTPTENSLSPRVSVILDPSLVQILWSRSRSAATLLWQTATI
jgi:hypothetical protein